DLAAVGRYKLNKKLSIRHRLVGTTAVDPIADPETGEVLVDAGQRITRQLAQQVTQAGVRAARVANSDGQELVVLGNGAPGTDQRTVLPEDVAAAVNYMVNLSYGIGFTDDIDHLGNRRLRS